MAKKNEEEVSFADMLLDLMKSQYAKKTQDTLRSKAKAGGVNRDLLRIAEKKKQEDMVRTHIMNQAKSLGLAPDTEATQGQDTLQGAGGGIPPQLPPPSQGPTGAPQGATTGAPGQSLAPQPGAPTNAPRPNPVAQASNPRATPLGQAGGDPRMAPGTGGDPRTQAGPRGVIDVPFEEVRGLPGRQALPGPQGAPQVGGPPSPSPQEAVQKGPGIQDLLKFLAMRTGVGAAGVAMAPTEVATGTYRPNEEVMPRDPDEEAVVLDPIKVEGRKSPSQKHKGKGVSPVLPGRKPSVPGSNDQEDPIAKVAEGPRFIQMMVPVPSDAQDDRIKEFVKQVGGTDWSFRDDYVGEMKGHMGG